MWSPKADHPLRRLFAALTEQTFMGTLGVGDPHLVDYLSELLSRFIHFDAIYRLRNSRGKRLEEVADMKPGQDVVEDPVLVSGFNFQGHWFPSRRRN